MGFWPCYKSGFIALYVCYESLCVLVISGEFCNGALWSIRRMTAENIKSETIFWIETHLAHHSSTNFERSFKN